MRSNSKSTAYSKASSLWPLSYTLSLSLSPTFFHVILPPVPVLFGLKAALLLMGFCKGGREPETTATKGSREQVRVHFRSEGELSLCTPDPPASAPALSHNNEDRTLAPGGSIISCTTDTNSFKKNKTKSFVL